MFESTTETGWYINEETGELWGDEAYFALTCTPDTPEETDESDEAE